MHVPAHMLNDSPLDARRGLRRSQQDQPGFVALSAILANHGRTASLSANEGPLMSIRESHPPLPIGTTGSRPPRTRSVGPHTLGEHRANTKSVSRLSAVRANHGQ